MTFEPTTLIFLTSGLFLGWSLGANDAANVFGTAVGSRMIRFTTAAIICGVFVILGAFVSGTGAAQTLGKLGAVNAIGGSFMAALAAGLTVYWMTKFGLPVSTSQAIIGSIIGWNLFSDSYTDLSSLLKILSTWIICPLLSGVIAALLYSFAKLFVQNVRIGLIQLDGYTRFALILAGAFGAYSLGANNIANVMGVFVPVAPFPDLQFETGFSLSSTQQLFLLGGLAISVGVFTYSKGVMMTVGSELMRLTPLAAWVAVMAHSIVLFLFASEKLEQILANLNLPTFPLVPVSSSQAVVGAVLGIGLLKGGQEIHWNRVSSIVKGWMITPIISCFICFVGLFFLQNVFQQPVKSETEYVLSPSVLLKLEEKGINTQPLQESKNRTFHSSSRLIQELRMKTEISNDQALGVIELAHLQLTQVEASKLEKLDSRFLTPEQKKAVLKLDGQIFKHNWQFADQLAASSDEWKIQGDGLKTKLHDRQIQKKLQHLIQIFQRRTP